MPLLPEPIQANRGRRLMSRLLVIPLFLVLATVASASSVVDSLTYYYAQHNVVAIERLHRNADTPLERLLCSYRLFPLTNNERWLENLPEEDELSSARALALLAAHWGFKAQRGPAWRLPTYGRRSEEILRRAQSIDPNEPYALLVDGQSLYYKPGLFGGDVEEARRRFEQLRNALYRNPAPGIHRFEPEVWIWMCLRKLESSGADQLRTSLLNQHPPPLFRHFLTNPPD